MKKLLPFLFLILPFFSLAQLDTDPLFLDKNFYQIHEKVAIKVVKEYFMEDGNKTLKNILEFGNKGLPVVLFEYEYGYDPKTKPTTETTYKYNAAGKLAQKTITSSEDDGYKVYYTYDASGKLIKKESVEIDPPTTIYNYDKTGKILSANITRKMPSYDSNGEFTGKSFNKPYGKYEYKININNKIIEEKYFWFDAENPKIPYYKNTFEYNKENKLIKKINYNSEALVNFTETYFYNDKGLLEKRIEINGDKIESVYQYEYCTDCVQSWIK